MNKIRAIQALNQKEIEHNISPNASWHVDYRDTAFVYFGGIPAEYSEGDIIVIFSQYGEPVWIKLARDQETGKSRGFGWLKYEDQRSCDLAVDNIGGAVISGRTISVDHARYKFRDDEDPEEGKVDWQSMLRREGKVVESEEESEEEERPRRTKEMLPEERELAKLIEEHDEEDPMKEFLIEEKKKEIEEAKERREKKDRKKKESSRSHRHRDRDEGRSGERRHRDREETSSRKRDRDESPGRSKDEGRHRSRRYRSDSSDRYNDRRKSRSP